MKDLEIVSYNDYITQMQNMMAMKSHKQYSNAGGRDLTRKFMKPSASTFDGLDQLSIRAWLFKMQHCYYSSSMEEQFSIQYAILHLEGVAHDWWYQGMNIQDHIQVNSFDEFCQKLIDIF